MPISLLAGLGSITLAAMFTFNDCSPGGNYSGPSGANGDIGLIAESSDGSVGIYTGDVTIPNVGDETIVVWVDCATNDVLAVWFPDDGSDPPMVYPTSS